MSSSYIDIDSTYRNRNENDLPSDFVVSQSRVLEIGNSRDAISDQVVVFPPQTPVGASRIQWEPLCFFQGDTDVECRRYLPFMFRTESSETLLLLDELPIASTSPTDLEIAPQAEFPTNSLALGRANNFYIGDILENVDAGESREIIGFSYSPLPKVLQSGLFTSYVVSGGVPLVELRNRLFVDNVFSTVNRFYQGKYLKFVDGEQYLVVNYFNNVSGSALFVLDRTIATIPAVDSVVEVVAKETWLAQIETPFTQSIPTYPAYSDPVPDAPDIFTKYSVISESIIPAVIIALAAVRHSDGTVGVACQTPTKVWYFRSSNTAGTEWETPVEIEAASSVDGTSCQSGYLHSIDLAIIDGNPAIAYTIDNVQTLGRYSRGTDASGSAWSVPSTVVSGVSNSAINNIRIAPRPDSDGLLAGYPMVALTKASGEVAVYGGTVSYATPTFVEYLTGEMGDVIDIDTYTYCLDINWVPASTALNVTFVYYRDTTTGRATAIWAPLSTATGMWEPPSFISANAVSIFGNVAAFDIEVEYTAITNITRYLSMCYMETTSGMIYQKSQRLVLDLDVRYDPATSVELLNNEVDVDMYFINPLQTELRTNIVYISDNSVTIQLIDSQSNPSSQPTFLDYSNILVFATLTDETDTNTMIFYATNGSGIDVLVPTANTYVEGVNYRIRQGLPAISANATVGTTTTVVLPATASSRTDFYKFSFVWIYNEPVNPIPAGYETVNEYRQITAYNGTTKTATFTPAIETSITSLVAALNVLTVEVLSYAKDSYSPLVVTGSALAQQESACYDVSLQSLVLPNITLSTGLGNRIAFYPYVYVEFSNTNTQLTNILFSNNPNAVRALFKVPVTNIVDPTRATFVSLNGQGMVQTVKLRVNEPFQFSVRLPNGELFETLELDTFPPFPPKPDLQVTATFGIKLARG